MNKKYDLYKQCHGNGTMHLYLRECEGFYSRTVHGVFVIDNCQSAAAAAIHIGIESSKRHGYSSTQTKLEKMLDLLSPELFQ